MVDKPTVWPFEQAASLSAHAEPAVQLSRSEGFPAMFKDRHLNTHNQIAICGARFATGSRETLRGSIRISGDRLARVSMIPTDSSEGIPESEDLDLSGWLVLPGFVNAHDHLHFSLFPRMGNPPYLNYVEWGDDIHRRYPDAGTKARTVPKRVRLWWGGIRNLLCGVTTVCHHDPVWPDLLREDFPVRVVSKFGWGHSLALGGDLRQARAATPKGRAFIVHACEGVDVMSRDELGELDRLGILDSDTVVVHGLALDYQGVALMRERGASVIVCPSSNKFLFERLPDLAKLREIELMAIGSDSPLTAEGDLLDEVRFAIHACGISPSAAYDMVTTAPAAILRLQEGEGSIKQSGVADLIAVRDTGEDPADRMKTLSMNDIELVIIGGKVRLASEAIWKRLPFSAKQALEPIVVDGKIRWLRAPVRTLLQEAEEVLGTDEVRLGGRKLSSPQAAEVFHAS